MSKLAPKFVAAAQVRSWQTAYNECNGCPMFAMLDGMEEIGPALLADMRAQMAVYDVWGGPNMPRIRFAMDVVQTGRIPTPPPGLPDDQVAEARTFLAHRKSGGPGGGTPTRRLKIALFWTRAAQHEAVSSALIQKARDLLKANKNLFHLDVLPDRTILPIDKTQNETDPESCGSGDFVEVQLLAEKSAAYSPDRIPVIFYTSDYVLGPYGAVRDPISHGCGYQPWAGKGFAMINSRKVMADNATLLHEVGHGAGLDHRLAIPKNIMSYGTSRTEFADDQLRVLGGCFFCSK
jgi:hypothetical protein